MNYTFATGALCLGLIWSTAAGSATAPIVGTYTEVKEDPLIKFNNDGTKQNIGTARSTRSVEFNADGTLRGATLSTYGKGSKAFYRGVWAQKDGWTFYIETTVTAEGTLVPNGSTYLGAEVLRPSADGLSVTAALVMPLGLAPSSSAKRTTSAELGAPVSVQDVADLRQALDRILQSIPRPTYAGAGSEDELKAMVHRAVATRDVESLLRVSYPTEEGLTPDTALEHYVAYMNWLGLPGSPTIREENAAAAQKRLAQLKQSCGCAFPESISPRGLFWIGRTANEGRDQSAAGFYYGVVHGQWAIIGSPLSEKAVSAKRLSKTQ